ncbi:MAG: beta-ketoacyl synthase chain length factor [Elusimicrobiota bacterium]|jgi:4-coumarate--CoA ligase (photoactive yellow protein activation family)|nr:beta-ketoacyl synthase chain length factor [Elusimicrobiota bacterium]
MNELSIKSSSFSSNSQGLSEFFDIKKLRRIDELSKLSLLCAAEIFKKENIDFAKEKDDIGLIIATGRGPIKQTCNFMDSIIDVGEILSSPLSFSASVHNSIGLTITSLLNLRGPCLTISQGATSFASALITAQSWLLSKRAKSVLVGAVDEVFTVTSKAFEEQTFKKNCAAFFLLTFAPSSDRQEKLALQHDKIDNLNPSLEAFDFAYKLKALLEPQDIKKIIVDFIKTYLAANKIKVMRIFESTQSIEELLKDISEADRVHIFEGLENMFGAKTKLSSTKLSADCFRAFAENNSITFLTSGSSGKKKTCTHISSMIKEEVIGVSKLFADIKRIVSVAPTHHSYGFIFGLQMPKYLNVPVESYPPLPNFKWNEILRQGDLLIAFPLFLDYLRKLDFKFEKGISILTSTAPCPDMLIDDMIKRGAKSIVEVYGSSESGAIAFRKKSGEPFSLFPFWKAEYENGNIEKISRRKTSLEIDFPDIMQNAGAGKFYIKGRKDGAVQVAGINVYPSKVENILKQLEYVKDVSVRLREDRLKAFVVLKSGIKKEDVEKEIYKHLNATLCTPEIPKNITFGDAVPVNQYGKKTDW